MVDFNLFDMLRMATQHIQYSVGEVFVIPRQIRSEYDALPKGANRCICW